MDLNNLSYSTFFNGHWDSLMGSAGLGLFETSLSGKLIRCNEEFINMLGYLSIKEFNERVTNISELYLSPDERKKIIDTAKNKEHYTTYTGMITKNGELLNVQINLSIKNNTIYGFIQDLSQVTETKEKLEVALDAAVTSLSKITELRDPYTSGHMRNVAKLSTKIGSELGLPKDEMQCLFYAALLHDIGKVYIPSELLTKPTRLTSKEFELIKEHSIHSKDILKEIPFFCSLPIAEAVLSHHERLDGSGYPNGLSDNEIPLHSQIIAIADGMEAMINHRPYRPALKKEKALKLLEIEAKQGKLDKELVKVNEKLFREDNFKF